MLLLKQLKKLCLFAVDLVNNVVLIHFSQQGNMGLNFQGPKGEKVLRFLFVKDADLLFSFKLYFNEVIHFMLRKR